jgi:cell division protein ZipA
MEALRWILLGLGGLLILGIWLVGLRRSKGSAEEAARAAAEASPHREGPAIGTFEPNVVDESFDIAFGASDPEPAARVREENPVIVEVPRGDPPIVTLDDLPESIEDIELVRPMPPPMREYRVIDAPGSTESVDLPVVTFDTPTAEAPPAVATPKVEMPTPRIETPAVEPPVKRRPWPFQRAERRRGGEPTDAFPDARLATEATIPSLREPPTPTPPVTPKPTLSSPASTPTPATATSDAPQAPEANAEEAAAPSATPLQRIVSIRLVLTRQQTVPGDQLAALLIAEGMKFGRYSIFHREVHGDRPIFSVASLVEPGYFDPNAMAGQRFPGVSFFAVLPGPLPAPQTFDDILSTARRLAERLGGVLQDDTGSTLTGQRILSLREELVYFEHLLSLARPSRR